MKKTLSLFLILTLMFALFSCGNPYEPVPSTEEEARTVMTLSFDGEAYEIKYELYRAFFLTYKSEIDGGDNSVWNGSDADAYIEKINKKIISSASQIFAVLHEAKKIGFDPYSASIDSKISDYVRVSVEGGAFGDTYVEGEGSYEKYLASLKAMNLNYSVQTLLIRYSLATAALEEHYLGDKSDILDEGGEFEYDEDDVRDYYFGDECASYMQIFLPSHAYTATRAKEIRDTVASSSTKTDAALAMHDYSISGYDEIFDGSVVGRYELDRAYFSDLSDAIFELAAGETSEPVKIGSGKDEGYYIVYRFEANADYFGKHYDVIEESYILNVLGKSLAAAEGALASSAIKTTDYSEIIHADISMD